MAEQDIVCTKCGSVNDFNIQDRGIHKTAFCNSCEAYIKNLPQGAPPKLHFGRYIGREIQSMISKEEVGYLEWLLKQNLRSKPLKTQIESHLSSL